VSQRPNSDFERRFEEIIRAEQTRRQLLRRGAAGALSVSAIAWLAACGNNETAGPKGKEAKLIPKGKISKTLYFANWPLYIDVNDKTKGHPTLDQFQKKYGTKVKYVEEINDNVEFFGKVNQEYAQGNSGGRDLHVVTDWLCNRMKRLGYVQKLDKSEMPNVVKNIDDRVASPEFDPKREFSVPWQTGQVLIIYRADKVGKEGPANANELLEDKKLKGKVTFLTEMRDSVGSVLLADGIKPEDATKDQCLSAIDKLEKGAKDGQIRRFTGNEYTKDISKGDSHAILGWSGDAVTLEVGSKDVKWRYPDVGFMIFTDSMQVPVGAPHAFTAEKFMNFVYDPEIQAQITAYVNYVPPVKGTKDVLEKKDPKIAANKLIFPDLSKSHDLKTFSPNDEREIDEAFQRAIGA
jgi:spermidine/putrescine transport system substrate-binding protein